MDDFALFAKSFAAAIELKDGTFALLDDLGLNTHPTKGCHTATQVGDYLGMTIDTEKIEIRAPNVKLKSIAALAEHLLVKVAQNKWWVPDKSLASLT